MSAQYNAAQYGPTPSWRYLDNFGMDTGFFVICNFWNSSYFGDVAPTTFKRPVQLRHEPSITLQGGFLAYCLIAHHGMTLHTRLDTALPFGQPCGPGMCQIVEVFTCLGLAKSITPVTPDMFSVVWHTTTSLPATLFSTQ